MKINKTILLECICHFYKYQFSNLIDYQIRNDYILSTVVSDSAISDFFIGTKSTYIDIDEYLYFIRIKKLYVINKLLQH